MNRFRSSRSQGGSARKMLQAHRPKEDLAGLRFGRLLVLSRRAMVIDGNIRRRWRAFCDCGCVTYVHATQLTRGTTQSCGCLARELSSKREQTHGASKTREYRIWFHMRRRCEKESARDWADYGGRGIKVCERWQDFSNFLDDVGLAPSPIHSIEREDNNGNYEPTNCRWATPQEQGQNRRTTKLITYNGRTQTMAAWARELGCHRGLLWTRIKRGWTDEDVVGKPLRRRGPCKKAQRIKPSIKVSVAAALLHVRNPDGSYLIQGDLRLADADTILKAIEWDHRIPLGLGGDDDFRNLQPLLKADHRIKTKSDVAKIAKSKRLRKAQMAHEKWMREHKMGIIEPSDRATDESLKIDGQYHQIASKPDATTERRPALRKRKMQSRGFQGWRAFDGTPRWKKK